MWQKVSGSDRVFFAFFIDDAANGLAGACSHANPILGALQIDDEIFTFHLGIIPADDFDEFPVARTTVVGHDDFVVRMIFGAFAAQTNCY
jgi:hypothetical protein